LSEQFLRLFRGKVRIDGRLICQKTLFHEKYRVHGELLARLTSEKDSILLARSTIGIIALVAVSLSVPPRDALAQDTIDGIAAQDKVQLRVLEWLPSKGEYKEWSAVSGEYRVSAAGTLSIPFVGQMAVTDRPRTEVSGAIARSLQQRLSLPSQPEVSVEIVARAPIYILGGVETPGRFEFTPGLKAIEAIALAGGFYRGGGGTLRLERDAINAARDAEAAGDNLARLEMRLARLEAELEGRDKVDARLSGSDADRRRIYLVEEQALFEVRRQARLSQLESARSRQNLASDQLKALDQKASNLDRQISLSKEQLANIEHLVKNRLAVASRAYDLERTTADLEGKRLDIEVARLSANLAINESQRDQVDLITKFRTDVGTEIQATRSAIAKAAIELDRAKELMNEVLVITPQTLTRRTGNLEVGVQIFLTRTGPDGTTTREIVKNEALRAGDTIQVQMSTEEADRARDTAAVQ
jgi:protein involved in polysaccharide export with SLBB domain